MKKFISVCALFLSLCLMLPHLVGCNFSSSNGGGNESTRTPAQSTITLYDGDDSQSCVVDNGQIVTVDVPAKKGYYLEGYFDANEGGTKYIDGVGNSLIAWQYNFPTTLYARWSSIELLEQTELVFDNEPKSGGINGQRTAEISLDDKFVSALKGNFDAKLRIEYSIDLKTGNGYDEASPIAMYITGYETSGADRHDIFKHTPSIGSFTTYSGVVDIDANDFVDGNIYIVVRNTKQYMMSWAYPVFYSRNLRISISLVQE